MSRNDVNKIRKNRYIIFENNNKLEIDIFEDDLMGLACLEVEFPDTESANSFSIPKWVKREVTNDISSFAARTSPREKF